MACCQPQISIVSAPDLTEVPPWIAVNASFHGTTACAEFPTVVIGTAADYLAYTSNDTLMAATVLGPVVITWPEIRQDQLEVVLQNKTSLGSLIIEGCNEIARLSPALDNVTTVTAGVVLDNLVALTAAELINLRFVGASLRVYRNQRMVYISANDVETVGGIYLYSLTRMTDASFDNVTAVNGSLTVSYTSALTGTAITNAFPRLTTVAGQFKLYSFSSSSAGAAAYSAVTLPMLQSVGSLSVQHSVITAFTVPALANVGGNGQLGQWNWYNLPRLVVMSAPALLRVTGLIRFSRLRVLTSLCGLGLDRNGQQGTTAIQIVQCAQLRVMDFWIAISARASGTTTCPITNAPVAPTTASPALPPSTPGPTGMPTTASPSVSPTTATPTTVPTALPTGTPTSAPTTLCNGIPDAPECSSGIVQGNVCDLVFAAVCPGHCSQYCTAFPTIAPTAAPSGSPTSVPTSIPTVVPTALPTATPTDVPTTASPTRSPTNAKKGKGKGKIVPGPGSGGALTSTPSLTSAGGRSSLGIVMAILVIIIAAVLLIVRKRKIAAATAGGAASPKPEVAFANPLYDMSSGHGTCVGTSMGDHTLYSAHSSSSEFYADVPLCNDSDALDAYYEQGPGTNLLPPP